MDLLLLGDLTLKLDELKRIFGNSLGSQIVEEIWFALSVAKITKGHNVIMISICQLIN